MALLMTFSYQESLKTWCISLGEHWQPCPASAGASPPAQSPTPAQPWALQQELSCSQACACPWDVVFQGSAHTSSTAWPWLWPCLVTMALPRISTPNTGPARPDLAPASSPQPGEFDFWLKYRGLPSPAPCCQSWDPFWLLGCREQSILAAPWLGTNLSLCVPSNKRMKLRGELQAQKKLVSKEFVSQHPCHCYDGPHEGFFLVCLGFCFSSVKYRSLIN